MTRDGTFLVENGRVQGGVRNFRFNESLIHMLSNVEAMSVPVRSCGEESFDMVVPAMKVRGFQFHRSDEVLREPLQHSAAPAVRIVAPQSPEFTGFIRDRSALQQAVSGSSSRSAKSS